MMEILGLLAGWDNDGRAFDTSIGQAFLQAFHVKWAYVFVRDYDSVRAFQQRCRQRPSLIQKAAAHMDIVAARAQRQMNDFAIAHIIGLVFEMRRACPGCASSFDLHARRPHR